MKVNVSEKSVSLTELSTVNEGEVGVNECEFTFPESFSGLTVVASFNNIPVPVSDNKCTIPSLKKGNAVLGVYAYSETDETVTLMYSPKPSYFYVNDGSYSDTVNSDAVPEISLYEQYCLSIKNRADEIVSEAEINCYSKSDSDSLLLLKENTVNKTTAISDNSSDTQYPTAKAVYTSLRKEPTLINTITVSDDETSSVEISLDSDGEGFILKNNISVYIETPIAGEALILYSRLQNQFALIFYSATSTTNALINRGSYTWNGYEWCGNQVVATALGVRGTVNPPAKYYATNKDISKIEITTNNALKHIPNGTVIRVYGENYA